MAQKVTFNPKIMYIKTLLFRVCGEINTQRLTAKYIKVEIRLFQRIPMGKQS